MFDLSGTLFHDQHRSPAKQQQMAKAEWFCFLVKTNLFFWGVIRYAKKEDTSKPLLKNPSPEHNHFCKKGQVKCLGFIEVTWGCSNATCSCWNSSFILEHPCQGSYRYTPLGTLHARNGTPQCYSARTKMMEENIMIKNVKTGKHEKAKKHEVENIKILHGKEKFIS